MCYHIKQTKALDIVADELGINAPLGNHGAYYSPSEAINGFNFPWVPILADDKPEQMILAKWWLMYREQKEQDRTKFNTLNTKVENVQKINSVCNVFQGNHALMIVDGFYEWQWQDPKGKAKRKYLMQQPRGNSFYLACLFNEWEYGHVGKPVKTVSVLTRPANTVMEHIHNSKKRMPVLLGEDMGKQWLKGDLKVEDFQEMKDYFEHFDLMTINK